MERHDLIHEFPGHRDEIHNLKVNNHHFKNLFDEYHSVDHEIHRIESGAELTADKVLNDLRFQRVFLKDQLVEYLK